MAAVISRGLRNNNPGNIRKSKDQWKGLRTRQTDSQFFQFESMAYGYRALMTILRNYQRKYGLRTVSDVIRRWAPPSENNTNAYICAVCRELQIPVTDGVELDLEDKRTLTALASAISKVENGTPAVAADVEAGYDLM
jgi:hypothetical protein